MMNLPVKGDLDGKTFCDKQHVMKSMKENPHGDADIGFQCLDCKKFIQASDGFMSCEDCAVEVCNMCSKERTVQQETLECIIPLSFS